MFQNEITVRARCPWVENFLARTVSKPSPGYSELGIVSLVGRAGPLRGVNQ